jgi:hypothetical protein
MELWRRRRRFTTITAENGWAYTAPIDVASQSDGRRVEFVASKKNRAWHIEKGKREYGITRISVFNCSFRDGVCPAGAISKTTPIYQ